MIVVEEKHDKKTEWHSHEHPFHLEVPKVNQPAAWLRWLEGFGDWDACHVSGLDCSWYMRETDPEEGAKLMSCQKKGKAAGRLLGGEEKGYLQRRRSRRRYLGIPPPRSFRIPAFRGRRPKRSRE